MREILDQEWIDLIWEAKKLGLSIEEVKEFLNHNRTHPYVDRQQIAGWVKSKSI